MAYFDEIAEADHTFRGNDHLGDDEEGEVPNAGSLFGLWQAAYIFYAPTINEISTLYAPK